jgi:hypothetical protein
MATSRERFLRQLERCVRHQPPDIDPGPQITSDPEPIVMGDVLEPEEMGNGEAPVECDTSSTWGLRPPGEEPPQVPVNVGDWA